MKKASMELYSQINNVLAEWDPIGVGGKISFDEYRGYIPAIINSSKNELELIICLEDILNQMGLDYNSSDPLHKKELHEISLKILSIIKKVIK